MVIEAENNKKWSIRDFIRIQRLGSGMSSQVFKVKDKKSQKLLVIKRISKIFIKKNRKKEWIYREINI